MVGKNLSSSLEAFEKESKSSIKKKMKKWQV